MSKKSKKSKALKLELPKTVFVKSALVESVLAENGTLGDTFLMTSEDLDSLIGIGEKAVIGRYVLDETLLVSGVTKSETMK